MSRALPWIVTAAALAGLVASVSEIRRLKTRIGEVSRHQFHDHAAVRQFMISAALAEADQPIVVLGDSITEMAPLPRELCGHPVVNAGIGGMTIHEATLALKRVLNDRRPYLIALALGANDVGSNVAGREFSDLLKFAARLTPRLVSVAVTSNNETSRQISGAAASAEVPYIDPPIDPTLKMSDGIHYNGKAYGIWIPALEAAVNAQCG